MTTPLPYEQRLSQAARGSYLPLSRLLSLPALSFLPRRFGGGRAA